MNDQANENKRKRDEALMVTNPKFKSYTAKEKRYYKNLSIKEQQIIVNAEQQVTNLNNTDTPLRFKILSSQHSDHVKAMAIRKIDYLEDLDASTGEYYKTSSWIDAVCKLPIGTYKDIPVNSKSHKSKIKMFLQNTRTHMDEIVYGHSDAKEQIIRLLAKLIINPNSNGIVIGIHGPMGCGKTTLVKECVCKVLGLPFAFIPLGGASDGSYLEGHNYTYEGASWGKIVDILMASQCMNPVLFFDELDKVSDTRRGEEIINILMHLTDQTQNDKIQDKYFSGFEFDLSKSLILFSYNDNEKINPVLKDRMISIETKGYTIEDKIIISKKHMIPSILDQYMLNKNDIVFTDEILKEIVAIIEEEHGVRNLKRALQDIVSHINLQRLTGEIEVVFPFDISENHVKSFVYNKRSKNKKFLTMYS